LLSGASAADGGKSIATKVRDISEFLMELGPVPPKFPLPIKATYHDACHLCHGQQIRKQPRQLLEMIPGLELLPLNETEICCGAAGSYNLTEPEMAERLGRRKANNILETNAQAVFTGNVGCLLQIGRYLRRERPDLWIAHPVDALWASYSGQMPFPLQK
jgi:glycolate oxidase iron-sulfur subunit